LVAAVDKWIKVDIQCNQAEQSAKPLTLESEKDMEFNTIMQALVKDLAEQLRPMVADMVKQELAKTDGDIPLQNLAASIDLARLAEYISDTQLATIAEHISDTQLVTVGENVNLSDLAAELTEGQLTDIAEVSRMTLGHRLGTLSDGASRVIWRSQAVI
jgi:hypothetical protein